MNTVLSLGAGVQSTALLLMALASEALQPPDCAIFADTGWEPPAVYAHLDWLADYSAARGVPVYRVSKGNLRADLMESGAGGRFASIPFHLRVTRGQTWTHGMARRQCTSEYKLRPLQRKVREFGATAKHPVTVWLGISTDEIVRAKASRVLYAIHRFPLIELGLSRRDCEHWLTDNGFTIPPKSACIGCPFHDNTGWKTIKADPAAWADACEVDAAIRLMPRFKGAAYLHRSLTPLGDVLLDKLGPESGELFDLECEGMCGL